MSGRRLKIDFVLDGECYSVISHCLTCAVCPFRSQAARGKEGIKDGVSEMGTRLDPVPGLPGGESRRV